MDYSVPDGAVNEPAGFANREQTTRRDRVTMPDNPYKKQDFLEVAKHQFAQASAEFEKALGALKDPERRKQMTSSYLEMLQKGLLKGQESVAKYQEKIVARTKTDRPDRTSPPESSAAPEPMAASRPEPEPPAPDAPSTS
jgi:hypothetical protein